MELILLVLVLGALAALALASGRRNKARELSRREDELAPVLEAKPERGRLRTLRTRSEVPDPPGAHQVHAELQRPVGGGEEQPLPAPAGSLQAPAFELAQRWVERLQGRDVGRPRLEHGRGRHERIELADPRLDLG